MGKNDIYIYIYVCIYMNYFGLWTLPYSSVFFSILTLARVDIYRLLLLLLVILSSAGVVLRVVKLLLCLFVTPQLGSLFFLNNE